LESSEQAATILGVEGTVELEAAPSANGRASTALLRLVYGRDTATSRSDEHLLGKLAFGGVTAGAVQAT
jgi:hypothetical protein